MQQTRPTLEEIWNFFAEKVLHSIPKDQLFNHKCSFFAGMRASHDFYVHVTNEEPLTKLIAWQDTLEDQFAAHMKEVSRVIKRQQRGDK